MNTLFKLLLAPFIALTTIFSPLPTPAPIIPTVPATVRLDIRHLQETVSNVDTRVSYLENHQVTPLGATFPVPTSVALFETSLATKISSSATSMTLVSGTDKTGTALASSTYAFIIDEGSADEEMVLADCTSTACTNMTRGISPITGTSTVAALQHEHRRGASVKITDGPQLMILSRIINGIGTFPNLLTYKSGTACTGSSGNSTICDKAYIDGVAVAGASNANETTKGIIELATVIEQASSTSLGSTAASLVLQAKNSTSTPLSSCNSTSIIGALCAIIAQNNGKIDPNFISTTSNYLWSGTNTFAGQNSFTATTTMATTTITSAQFGGNIVNNYTGAQAITGATTPVPVMMATSTGRVSIIDSDVASTTATLLGFAINTCGNGTTCYVQTAGIVNGFTGLTAGLEYYVSDTAGVLSTTVGTSENYVGRAVSATAIQIDTTRSWQYLGSQNLGSGANTINQPWWRFVVVNGSFNDGTARCSAQATITLAKNGIPASGVQSPVDSAGGGYTSCSAAWTVSGNTLTMSSSVAGNASGVAYYYR